MSDILVDLPDGRRVSFPEGTSREVMANALQKLPPEQKKEFNFDAMDMVGNIPGSAAQLGSDIWSAVSSPLDTLGSIGNLALGTAQLAIPGEQGSEDIARQVGGYLGDRYGGWDEMKQTLQDDPVGLLSDAAGLVTGGAGLAAKTAATGGRIAKVANTVGKIGAAVEPLNLVTKPVGAAIKAGINTLPNSLMQSSAKFGTTLNITERTRMAETMLENKILPNVGGYDKLQKLTREVGGTIDDMIKVADETGSTVPIERVLASLNDVIDDLGGPTLGAADDVAEAVNIATKYLDEMKASGISRLSASDLQKFKTDAYKRIKWRFGETPPTRAREQVNRSMAREAKGAIEQMSPDISSANARMGRLLELAAPLERTINRIDNRDMIGLGLPVKTMTGAHLADVPGAIAGVAQGIADAPVPKARMAQRLYDYQQTPYWSGGGVVGQGAMVRAAAGNLGRLSKEEEEDLAQQLRNGRLAN